MKGICIEMRCDSEVSILVFVYFYGMSMIMIFMVRYKLIYIWVIEDGIDMEIIDIRWRVEYVIFPAVITRLRGYTKEARPAGWAFVQQQSAGDRDNGNRVEQFSLALRRCNISQSSTLNSAQYREILLLDLFVPLYSPNNPRNFSPATNFVFIHARYRRTKSSRRHFNARIICIQPRALYTILLAARPSTVAGVLCASRRGYRNGCLIQMPLENKGTRTSCREIKALWGEVQEIEAKNITGRERRDEKSWVWYGRQNRMERLRMWTQRSLGSTVIFYFFLAEDCGVSRTVGEYMDIQYRIEIILWYNQRIRSK